MAGMLLKGESSCIYNGFLDCEGDEFITLLAVAFYLIVFILFAIFDREDF